MDGVSVAMGAVALVLAGVWAVARYGERLAPLPRRTDPVLRRVGLASMAVGVANLGYALLLLVVERDLGRFLWHTLSGAVLLASGREMRRGDEAIA